MWTHVTTDRLAFGAVVLDHYTTEVINLKHTQLESVAFAKAVQLEGCPTSRQSLELIGPGNNKKLSYR